MQPSVRWTNLSRRSIARAVTQLGTPISHHIVGQWLYTNGFRRRQMEKKQTMGSHENRNEQFERIKELKQEYIGAGHPVISMDTKKKELLGNFYREGVIECQESIVVNDHDFPSTAEGKLIPHGIYDIGKNTGSIHLNASHDTTELACDSLALWWKEQGRYEYPNAQHILVLCDGGGSNSASTYIFKEDLQNLANILGLEIRIAHFPPYCSKFNPIEHRMFPHVTRAVQGVVLRSIEVGKEYMKRTSTETGLKVVVRQLERVYQTGRKYTEGFKKSMKIVFDERLPKWNYTAVPQTGVPQMG